MSRPPVLPGEATSPRTFSRRTVAKGAVWSVPVIAAASTIAPGTAAASTTTTYSVPATAVPTVALGVGTQANAVTTVTITAGQRITLTATGTTVWGRTGTTNLTANAAGDTSGTSALENKPVNGFVPLSTYGALVGRFGLGAWFLVGASYTSPAGQTGTLQLAYNDNPNGAPDNTGAYAVTVRVTP